MIQLFLSEPNWGDPGDDGSVQQRISLLNKLQSKIRSILMSSGVRSEARLWLCNSIASITSITPHQQRDLFMKMLRSKPLRREIAGQILQMIFEKQPQKAGSILSKKSHLLESFFQGNPMRILQWFSNFDGSGNLGHRRGAKALSQFAFVNRDICWEELEWKGKHGQSPAMVATKPHYFLDLDVQRTVENFLENVPEFWSSNEFADSLKDGEIFFLDRKFFLDLFVDLMFNEDTREVWDIITMFVMEEPFSSLCHRLLIILEERDFLVFLESLCKVLDARIESMDFGNPSYWLEIILSKCSNSIDMDQLLLLNAVVSQGRQLMRVVREEEDEDGKEIIKEIVAQISMCSSHPSSLAPIMKEFLKAKSIEPVQWLGIQSWVLHYRLSEECQTPGAWESLFIDNGIRFLKPDNRELLNEDDGESDLDERVYFRVRRKKKEKRKKKKRKYIDDDDAYGNELLGLAIPESKLSLQFRAGNWLLSTDGYSTSWSSVDLPEHLSKHCFSTWMKWICAKMER